MSSGAAVTSGKPAFRPSAEMVLVALDRDTLVYHRERGKLLVLNPSAAAILKLCDGTRAEEEIARRLADSYPDAGGGNLEGDVRRTVAELADLGVLTMEVQTP